MLTRRDFVRSTTATLAAAATVPAAAAPARSAELLLQRTIKPVVIAVYSGFEFTNSGKENAVARAGTIAGSGSCSNGRPAAVDSRVFRRCSSAGFGDRVDSDRICDGL